MKKLNTDLFIKKAKNIYGNKYDYSLVDYKNSRTKVEIICKKHGKFYQRPTIHLFGQSCKQCNIYLTTNEFIKKAKKIHGNKYDYRKSVYENYKKKLIIICKIHGEFNQRPSEHICRKRGCPSCAINKKLSNEDFIKLSKKIHKNRYDYTNTNYINSTTKLYINCKTHGKFIVSPRQHLKGSGCKKCLGKILNTIDFIEKSKNVHGNKYDYSLVKFIKCDKKVKIICKLHGVFNQNAGEHYRGKNCPICMNSVKLTNKQFIEKSKKIHGNRYDYSLVDYKNNKTKVCIICKKHGRFYMNPKLHWRRGSNCPKCSNRISKPETEFLNHFKIKKRQIYINPYWVDGLNLNIVYEFLGDFWHGNLEIYKKNNINKIVNKTFGELHKNTFKKFDFLIKNGYIVKYVWENDWIKFKTGIDKKLKINIYGKSYNK